MSEVKVETLEENFDQILQLVGEDSFVDWDSFTKSSSEATKAIDELTKALTIYREAQHRTFIQVMKKLKSYDIPDIIKTVKAKKLPREVLRSILSRFKLTDGKLELSGTVAELKEGSAAEFEEYRKGSIFRSDKLKEFTILLNGWIQQSGYVPETPPEPKQLTSTVKFNISAEKIQEIASNVQIQYLPGTHDMIGMKTYVQIVQGSFDLIKTEFHKLTCEARIKQRALLKEPKKYLDALTEYLTNTEALIIEGQKLIAEKVGISSKKFEESELALMQRGLAQNILMIQSSMRAKVKQSMPPSQDISLQVAQEVIKHQIDLINDQFEPLKEIFSGLQRTQESIQLIPMLLALYLNDMVFLKFGYEQEDFMKNVGESVIMSNPKLGEIFKEMEIAIIKLMQKLEIIPENVSQYMLQATQQRSNEPAGQNPLGGMMPGSNPMEMLQMQQMAQFQQMQQMMMNKK